MTTGKKARVARLVLAAIVALSVACAGNSSNTTTTDGAATPTAPEFKVGGGLVPHYEPDPLHFELLPNKWTTGAVGNITVDKHDNVWIIHRPASIPDGEKGLSLKPPTADCCIPAPSVIEFSPEGKFIQAWGGPGEGYEWFSNEHSVWVDSEDNVWLTGSARNDNQILKFTRDGKFLLQIGHAGKNKGSNDTENVGGPADLFLYEPTNELFVADGYINRRIIVFDAKTGAYKRHWGAYGNKPDDSVKLPPRADYVNMLARSEAPPRQFGSPVHSVQVTRDGLVYAADRSQLRIQVFKLDGTFVREAFIRPGTLDSVGSVHEFDTSPDADETFLYVADGGNGWVHILDRATMRTVSRVGGRKGHGAREFFHLHSFRVDSKGNIYIGEVNNGQRFYRWRFTGMGAPENMELPQ